MTNKKQLTLKEFVEKDKAEYTRKYEKDNWYWEEDGIKCSVLEYNATVKDYSEFSKEDLEYLNEIWPKEDIDLLLKED